MLRMVRTLPKPPCSHSGGGAKTCVSAKLLIAENLTIFGGDRLCSGVNRGDITPKMQRDVLIRVKCFRAEEKALFRAIA